MVEPLRPWPRSPELLEDVDIKVRLNVEREHAEELYDEIEGHLALCLEMSLERLSGPDIYSKLERTITATALTGFLIEKLGNDQVKVVEVGVMQDHLAFKRNFYAKIVVPNLWAVKYGKELTDDRLKGAIEWLSEVEEEEEEPDVPLTTKSDNVWFNGFPVNPIIGTMYYDQLGHKMKLWDGGKWIVVV